MTRVEDSKLHGLVGSNILDELCPDEMEWRPRSRAELVLNDPLTKGLRDDWPSILRMKLSLDELSILVCCLGSDAVHHAVGEGHLMSNPSQELRFLLAKLSSKPECGIASHVPIALEVVARQDSEGSDPCAVSASKCFDDVSKDTPGVGSLVFSIVIDVWVARLKRSQSGVQVVTAFGYGERHDSNFR
jgi:hypothetical protein